MINRVVDVSKKALLAYLQYPMEKVEMALENHDSHYNK
jgi:hypothetical protein